MLNREQQRLVLENLSLVNKVIFSTIQPKKGSAGMDHDDLYQEGSVALCLAALRYDGRTSFPAFARKVIRNHLLDMCRAVSIRESHELVASEEEDFRKRLESIPAPDKTERDELTVRDAARIFSECGRDRSGYEQAGLEALWLHLWGFPVSEISRRTGMTPSQINKRMKAARTLLQQSPELRRALS